MGARTALRTLSRTDMRTAPRTGMGEWTPRYLFAANEAGAWYDPTDLGTMFTTSDGTTPVTAVEQAVGLILDKSRGLAIGAELVTNGDFSGGLTSWTNSSAGTGTAAVSSGVLTLTRGADSNNIGAVDQQLTTVANTWYRVTLTAGGAGGPRIFVGTTQGGTTLLSYAISPVGAVVAYFMATGTTSWLRFNGATNNSSVTIDDVSIKAVSGTHAIQATAASRPVLRNRYNLLTFSEQFDNAAWIKQNLNISANSAAAPDGTTTADLCTPTAGTTDAGIRQELSTSATAHTFSVWLRSTTGSSFSVDLRLTRVSPFASVATDTITVTTAWQRFTLTATPLDTTTHAWRVGHGSSWVDGETLLIWGADLRSANDTIYPYQQIAAATVYDSDTSKFPLYLALDGSDDSLYTAANLDLSGTDKVTVFAGVTKLSDAATGVFAELSAASGGGQAFAVWAPNGAADNYQVRSMGTVDANFAVSGYAAPKTNALTMTGNISAPLLELRIDGASVNSSTNTQGTGNYGTFPLYIGRRNNASNPFNGRIQQLIVRGAASSAAEIASTERYVAGKQGRAL